MLEKEKTIPAGRKGSQKMSEIGKRKRFEFQTRGKITAKESKELKRTHNNIFDWVKKQKKVLEEKDNFEKSESVEMETEPMEISLVKRKD